MRTYTKKEVEADILRFEGIEVKTLPGLEYLPFPFLYSQYFDQKLPSDRGMKSLEERLIVYLSAVHNCIKERFEQEVVEKPILSRNFFDVRYSNLLVPRMRRFICGKLFGLKD